MKRLSGHRGILFDTCVLIYLFEDIAPYAEACQALLQGAADGHYSGIISPITASELLVKPLMLKRYDVADRYRAALRSLTNIREFPLNTDTGVAAAALKAKYGLPLPDMLQVAAALQADPARPALVTNDRHFNRITEVTVFQLDSFLSKSARP